MKLEEVEAALLAVFAFLFALWLGIFFVRDVCGVAL